MADTTKARATRTVPQTPETPATRDELIALHRDARRRRNAAVLGSHDWEQAQAEVGRIEVEIARIERAMDPPRV